MMPIYALVGFAGLLLLQFFAEFLVVTLGIPVPAPVLGMMLLFVLLLFIGKYDKVFQAIADLLLGLLPLLLVPPGVGLMLYFQLLSEEWLDILLALGLSTLVALVVVIGLLKKMRVGDRIKNVEQELNK